VKGKAGTTRKGRKKVGGRKEKKRNVYVLVEG
jgi:hypothetical protein